VIDHAERGEEEQQQTKIKEPSRSMHAMETIPEYLSRGNKPFEEMLRQASTVIPNETSALRRMALLMYHVVSIALIHSLWTIYLRSGTGAIHSDQGQCVRSWPREVQSSVVTKSDNNDDAAACQLYTETYLRLLEKKLKQCQTELNAVQAHLHTVTTVVESYVQQGLQAQRRDTEHKIALVQFDVNDQALEIAFAQQQPSHHQVSPT
jgi:hypothetical protein